MILYLIILLLALLCYIIYTYSSSQIVQLRKQVMLLINQNNELEAKLKSQIDINIKRVKREEQDYKTEEQYNTVDESKADSSNQVNE